MFGFIMIIVSDYGSAVSVRQRRVTHDLSDICISVTSFLRLYFSRRSNQLLFFFRCLMISELAARLIQQQPNNLSLHGMSADDASCFLSTFYRDIELLKPTRLDLPLIPKHGFSSVPFTASSHS